MLPCWARAKANTAAWQFHWTKVGEPARWVFTSRALTIAHTERLDFAVHLGRRHPFLLGRLCLSLGGATSATAKATTFAPASAFACASACVRHVRLAFARRVTLRVKALTCFRDKGPRGKKGRELTANSCVFVYGIIEAPSLHTELGHAFPESLVCLLTLRRVWRTQARARLKAGRGKAEETGLVCFQRGQHCASAKAC